MLQAKAPLGEISNMQARWRPPFSIPDDVQLRSLALRPAVSLIGRELVLTSAFRPSSRAHRKPGEASFLCGLGG